MQFCGRAEDIKVNRAEMLCHIRKTICGVDEESTCGKCQKNKQDIHICRLQEKSDEQLEYMADAVPQIASYPTVSVAWAAYLGLAVAYGWDTDWETFLKMPYQSYYGEQGFDDMDEHIVRDLLRIPLDSRTAKDLENTIRACGEKIVGLIRFEQIPPQSEMAFHVFAHACKVMFRMGAAIQLKRMGYNFEKVNLGN